MKFYDDLVRELKSLGWIRDVWMSGDFLYITPVSAMSQDEGKYVEDTIAAYGYGYDNIWSYDFPQFGDIEIRLRPMGFSKQRKFGFYPDWAEETLNIVRDILDSERKVDAMLTFQNYQSDGSLWFRVEATASNPAYGNGGFDFWEKIVLEVQDQTNYNVDVSIRNGADELGAGFFAVFAGLSEFSKQKPQSFVSIGVDSAFGLDAIFDKGVKALMRMNPSPECLRAIEAIQDAIRYDSFSDIADAVVTAWQYYGDMMYEQERENWAYHLVDPILDAING